MSELLVEVHDAVLIMTLNRPQQRNALNAAVTSGISAGLAQLAGDVRLRAGVLRARGDGFCAGMDLKEFKSSGPPPGLREMLRARSAKPLIAALEGYALGGGLELALMCDLVVAARGTVIGLPEATLGLLATGGALFRIPEPLVTEMALTGDRFTAEQAHAHGLVSRLVEPGQAATQALALATRIAANGPLSTARTLELIRARAGRTEDQLWEILAPIRDEVFASADAREGATAFAERRTPTWTGQ